MEKRKVKFVRLFPAKGKKLKVTMVNRHSHGDPTYTAYPDDGYLVAEDDIIDIEEIDMKEWTEGRKTYGWCTCLGC